MRILIRKEKEKRVEVRVTECEGKKKMKTKGFSVYGCDMEEVYKMVVDSLKKHSEKKEG